jgi:hypothetical protein
MNSQELRDAVDRATANDHRSYLTPPQLAEFAATFIPNLAALHPATEIRLWKEYKPARDEIEYTIYYQEPGDETKYRIDAVMRMDAKTSQFGPSNVRIKFWGPR